jgi:SAM-dependent methyltransferase
MFERYNEQARRGLFFARNEASEIGGFEIDTEHLLLGLLRVGKGRASRLFVRSHMSLQGIRHEVASRTPFANASRPRLDVSGGLAEQYDVVTTFDVVHDAADPRGLLHSIRAALRPDGIYVCLDINCSDKLEENAGPLGAMFHGFSVLYCMTTSLANGGVGLGKTASMFRHGDSRRYGDGLSVGRDRKLRFGGLMAQSLPSCADVGSASVHPHSRDW